jgi:phage shock protein A
VIGRKLGFLLRSRAAARRDSAEDSAAALDASYDRQLELLQHVKKARAAVLTARKQLEAQEFRLRALGARLEEQARQALASDREDAARQALERRAAALAEAAAADEQVQALQAREDDLLANEQSLTERIARFRSEKETLKANYAAAKALVEIGEAATGLGEETADVGIAVRLAREKTEELQARAAALDELVASGTLEAPGVPTRLDRELAALSSGADVDADLSRLKAELVETRRDR